MSVNVLMVDDNKDMCRLIKDVLGEKDFTVWIADNSDDGFRLFQNNAFDIMIVDYTLPGSMNGLELMKAALKRQSSIKILLISAGCSDNVKKSALEMGACGFLAKPFNLMQLAGILMHYIGSQNRNRANFGNLSNTAGA